MPRNPRHASRLPRGLHILHEDRDLIVVEKPAGLLTVASDHDREHTVEQVLTDYIRKGQAKSRLRAYTVHRLDRYTSGVLIFAKSEQAKETLQDHWPDTEKHYLAVVHGVLEKDTDTITSYLAENRAQVVYSTSNADEGKLSHTKYTVIKRTEDSTLIDVHLLTGRKNQIRVHMADIRHPVIGDRKYGNDKQPADRLALHAWWIAFDHPHSGARLRFAARVPGLFRELVGPFTLPTSAPESGGVHGRTPDQPQS